MTIRDLSSLVDIPVATTHCATNLLDYSCYDAIKVQELTDSQKEMRLKFCATYLRWNNECKRMIWWSDESLFSLNDLYKFKRTSYLAKENEYRICDKKFDKKKINVWVALRGDGKLIFRILDGIQLSENYIQLLYNVFQEMDFQNSFLMQDGAGIHTSDDAVDWINFLWKDRWIGLKSSRLEFPPHSMDLTPLDFSFWSYVKRKVAAANVQSVEGLREAICIEINRVPQEIIINMCLEVAERCRKCIMMNGGRFERYSFQ